MPLKTPFAGMSQEDTLALIAIILMEIKEKLPRVDANDRLITNGSEVNTNVTVNSGVTVNNGNIVTTIGSYSGFNNSSYINHHTSNAGCQHIYDNIRFI